MSKEKKRVELVYVRAGEGNVAICTVRNDDFRIFEVKRQKALQLARDLINEAMMLPESGHAGD